MVHRDRHQHRPRGRTGEARIEISQQHAVGRKHVEIWSRNLTAKNAEIAEAKVVGQDKDYVRTCVGSRCAGNWRARGCCLGGIRLPLFAGRQGGDDTC